MVDLEPDLKRVNSPCQHIYLRQTLTVAESFFPPLFSFSPFFFPFKCHLQLQLQLCKAMQVRKIFAIANQLEGVIITEITVHTRVIFVKNWRKNKRMS